MNIYAIVENGVVVNRTQAEGPLADNWLENAEAQIGWTYAGGVFSPPVPEPDHVPQVITIRQAKLALLAAGLLDDVDAAVAQADRATQIEWEYATELHRNWPTLVTLAAALGMHDSDVDDLFIQAASL